MATQKVTHSGECCPITRASKLVGDLWVIMIVKELLTGAKRYTELCDSINNTAELGNISTRTLSQRLKFLEKENIIHKRKFKESPPHTEYSLTETGRALSAVVEQLRSFGEQHLL
jgi:DNA-binding HxlR family transcriptional regulator